MATKILNYEMHGVCETSDLTSVQVGHLYSLKAPQAMDNGSVVALGDYVKGDVWDAKIPAKEDKLILINTSVLIYEEYTKKCQEEARFYNEKDDIMRGFEMKDTDKFAISAEAFHDDAVPAVGKYVAVNGTSEKLMVYDDAPTDTGFVGYIYDTATNGNFRIIVKKNVQLGA